ncbi:MAG: aminopeptidase [Bacilli bacterium]|nr:aminopeptidase [Bacilli bacterium]
MEQELAKIIVNHSLKVKKDEKVLITYEGKSKSLVKHLIDEIDKVGGVTDHRFIDEDLDSYHYKYLNNNLIDIKTKKIKYEVENYDCFIRICYCESDYYDKNVNMDWKKKLLSSMKTYKDIQVNERRWVLLNYPSLVDSNKAKMNPDDFYNFAMKCMTVDYEKMYHDMLPLKKLMEKTDKVRIVGPGTDISFNIKGMPAIICAGTCNIPDGECFTAPIKNSVNGVITYNTPSPYLGNVYENVRLVFRDGKIIEATSNHTDLMNEIFDSDDGARYVGEFSLGLNPAIKEPMGDILYDEKICGSIHFTPGTCYNECNNGNHSQVHWDLVLIQRKDYGGGEIYFDNRLIRKDGLFVIDELKPLNYEGEE